MITLYIVTLVIVFLCLAFKEYIKKIPTGVLIFSFLLGRFLDNYSTWLCLEKVNHNYELEQNIVVRWMLQNIDLSDGIVLFISEIVFLLTFFFIVKHFWYKSEISKTRIKVYLLACTVLFFLVANSNFSYYFSL
ncbi:hypothetical protein MYX07_02790 [Patescibacteria group bacterium AH-259-L07]|nr:hypothetical protein [Patescibacteria group bacterium AH-259-L07]